MTPPGTAIQQAEVRAAAALDDHALLCAACGYDVRAAARRCPECGALVEQPYLVMALLPWEQRGRQGWSWSWWRTAWPATLRPGRTRRAVALPPDEASAERFAQVNAGLAAAGGALVLMWWLVEAGWGDYGRPGERALLLAGVAAAVVAQALWWWALARLPRCWCRRDTLSPARQRAAAALMLYGSAGLAIIGAAGVLSAAVWVALRVVTPLGGLWEDMLGVPAAALAAVVAGPGALVGYAALLRSQVGLLPAGGGGPSRQVVVGAALLVIGPALGALLLTTLPGAAYYAALMLTTFGDPR